MPEVWMDGLNREPGNLNPYFRGRSREDIVKVHATAKNGAGNVTVGKNGHFAFYVPKEGAAMQFYPADAVTMDSGPFNEAGPGIEFEREGTGEFVERGLQIFEPLTTDQVEWGKRIFAWLGSERGYPVDLYDGPRFQATPNFRGFVNHSDLDKDRSDGVTRDEWETLTPFSAQGNLPPLPEGVTMADLSSCVGADGTVYIFCVAPDDFVWVTSKPPGQDWDPAGFAKLNGKVRK